MDDLIKHLLAIDGQATNKIFLNEITRLMEEVESLRAMLDKCNCETNLRTIKKVKKSSRILK